MKIIKITSIALLFVLFFAACKDSGSKNKSNQKEAALTPTEAKAIAKDAYIFAYPMLEVYKTMYVQAIDKNSGAYKGEFNEFHHMAK